MLLQIHLYINHILLTKLIFCKLTLIFFCSYCESKKPPPENTQNYTVPFVTLNKSVKTSDGLDHQNPPEENLHQIDAHLILSMGEQPLDTN